MKGIRTDGPERVEMTSRHVRWGDCTSRYCNPVAQAVHARWPEARSIKAERSGITLELDGVRYRHATQSYSALLAVLAGMEGGNVPEPQTLELQFTRCGA